MPNFNPRGDATQRSNYGVAVSAVDLGAASLSTAASLLTGNAAYGTGVTSSVKWAITGASEATNHNLNGAEYSRVQRAANATNTLAGVASATSSIAAHYSSSSAAAPVGFGYLSAASWAASGVLNLGRGVYNTVTKTGRDRASGFFQAVSGAANVAAAGYSAASFQAASNNDDTGAARNATISSALWMGGAAAGMVSNYLGRPAAARVHPAALPAVPGGLPPPGPHVVPGGAAALLAPPLGAPPGIHPPILGSGPTHPPGSLPPVSASTSSHVAAPGLLPSVQSPPQVRAHVAIDIPDSPRARASTPPRSNSPFAPPVVSSSPRVHSAIPPSTPSPAMKPPSPSPKAKAMLPALSAARTN